MPTFLSREDIYRILQRELPEDTYPDGAPSAYYSTADMHSVADVAASAYVSASGIYYNLFPQTADEQIADQETKWFGEISQSPLTLQQRRNRILSKIRTQTRMRKSDILALAQSVVGPNVLVKVIEWGCYTGGWMLDYSELGVETYLSSGRLTDATGPGLCHKKPSDFGLTEEEWEADQETAYTFEVLIYDA